MMAPRKLAAVAAVVLGLTTTAVSIGAQDNPNHTMYLTFNRPVALPGVALGSGTYIFETPDPMGGTDLVRVLSRDRRIVYLTAFTNLVNRPSNVPADATVTFREAAPNTPQRISVWWSQSTMGRQFIYPHD